MFFCPSYFGFGKQEIGEIPALAKGRSWAVAPPSHQKISPRVAGTQCILLHGSGETGAAFSYSQRLGGGFMASVGAAPSVRRG